MVAIDLMVGLPRSEKGNVQIIVAIDHFSKWVEARATADRKATTIAKFVVEQIIARHGAPKEILTDNALEFKAQTLKEIKKLVGTHHIYSSAHYHQGNAIVERVNHTLMERLACILQSDQADKWDEHLQLAVFAVNTAKHATTGYSPF